MSDLAVLVPVLARPGNLEPLIESFAVSDTPGDLIFLPDYDDQAEIDELDRLDCTYVLDGMRTWPKKINLGYALVRDQYDWVLFGADDLAFHSGWWEATKPLRDQPEIMVIGTNDLGNPRVVSGDHTCHPLVRSSYLGTIDDPTKIVCDKYAHWCVDDEFVWTAKVRGVWSPCLAAVVEHLHPYWGKAPMDDVYALGEANSNEDVALWRERAPLLGLRVA